MFNDPNELYYDYTPQNGDIAVWVRLTGMYDDHSAFIFKVKGVYSYVYAGASSSSGTKITELRWFGPPSRIYRYKYMKF